MDIDIPVSGTTNLQFEQVGHDIAVGFEKGNLCRGTTHFNHAVTIVIWQRRRKKWLANFCGDTQTLIP
jgi:hypothetical protein